MSQRIAQAISSPCLPRFEVVTEILASRERCFDLSRDIDLHVRSMAKSGERVVGGRASGLIGAGEEVTWEARHFGVTHRHRSRITAFDPPSYFRDEMVEGRFRRFEHDHFFQDGAGVTLMRDVIVFASPFGPLGWLADRAVLRAYLEKLIRERNRVIKNAAET